VTAVLIVVGVALIVFGAYVLLRHSDRPGGTLKWFGFELSSAGAGLPLVALGLGCILFAAVGRSGGSRDGAAERAADAPVAAAGTQSAPNALAADSGACFAELFAALPADRVGSVEAGVRDFDLVGSHQPLEEPFGIRFTDGGTVVGAARMRWYPNGFFRIEALVDPACRPAEGLRNLSRGGDPRAPQNWDTVRMRLGDAEYTLRIGAETSIRLTFLRVP
jgi:hypothetical protein